ncbi:hypothetical protein [Candidatus Albibeggiatoa sp. nov. NOAA]|uniref:hypothetical protein n=1 Tax=Candidatus Albibeggiatoa sp. nov. NOAA TaxID=3162724 RepID=UPI0032FACDAA|nr:hypothetical protein [Thiotrichaceae bacterium]
MAVPIHKNPSSDLTIFVDPSWLVTSEKYLISHALETVLTELSPEHVTQRKIDDFVNSFSGIYQLTDYDIQNFCTRLKQTTPSQHTTKLIEFISLYNTVSSRITQNFYEISDCLHKSFELSNSQTLQSQTHYNEVLCAGIEYAVSNIKKGKSIVMITGSPAKTECQRVIEMAIKRRVKIHVLFASDIKANPKDVQFYKHMTNALDSQFFELKRSFITEMQLERIFRSIIIPSGLASWQQSPRRPDNPYRY